MHIATVALFHCATPFLSVFPHTARIARRYETGATFWTLPPVKGFSGEGGRVQNGIGGIGGGENGSDGGGAFGAGVAGLDPHKTMRRPFDYKGTAYDATGGAALAASSAEAAVGGDLATEGRQELLAFLVAAKLGTHEGFPPSTAEIADRLARESS